MKWLDKIRKDRIEKDVKNFLKQYGTPSIIVKKISKIVWLLLLPISRKKYNTSDLLVTEGMCVGAFFDYSSSSTGYCAYLNFKDVSYRVEVLRCPKGLGQYKIIREDKITGWNTNRSYEIS